jgi:serine/threonine-protein kinase HipA
MDENGIWQLSPAYDMGYAYNPNGGWTDTHQMSINGKFDNITREDLLSFAHQNNIKEAPAIIDEVCEATSHWPEIAKDCGVPSAMVNEIVSNMLLDF